MFNTDDITVLFAAAGCGKTTYLKKQVRKAVKDTRPEDIAFVSFTRKGAEIGRSQVARMLDIEEDRLPFFKTLHALTFSALGYDAKDIFNFKHAKKLSSLIGANITLNGNAESASSDDKIIAFYDAVRSGYAESIPVEDRPDMVQYERIVRAYEAYKAKYGLVDFMDCLLNFVKRGKPVPVSVAFIDEAQDLTQLQWQVCDVAFAKAKKIFVAGDDYQSIYTYAGARPDILIDLANNHKTVKLERSYRLPKKVYRYAKAITDMLHERMDKDYAPMKNVEGSVTRVDDNHFLAEIVERRQDESWLILFRNNYHIQPFEHELYDRLVPFYNQMGFCLNERYLDLIKRYYSFRLEGYSSKEQKEAFMKRHGIKKFSDPFYESNLVPGDVKYTYFRYVEKYGIEKLVALAKEATTDTKKIIVSTIHRAKGAEARNVIVFLDCSTKVYKSRFDNLDTELRLLYVAFTRAEERLYLAKATTGYGLDDIVDLVEETIGE